VGQGSIDKLAFFQQLLTPRSPFRRRSFSFTLLYTESATSIRLRLLYTDPASPHRILRTPGPGHSRVITKLNSVFQASKGLLEGRFWPPYCLIPLPWTVVCYTAPFSGRARLKPFPKFLNSRNRPPSHPSNPFPFEPQPSQNALVTKSFLGILNGPDQQHQALPERNINAENAPSTPPTLSSLHFPRPARMQSTATLIQSPPTA